MKPSINFINLCHDSEGCKLKAYKDTGGVWTIGYGHTLNVHEGDTCTQEQANEYFLKDCQGFTDWLNKQGFNQTQNGYDATLDLIYNIGPGNFAKDTSLYYAVKTGNQKAIIEGFKRHVTDRTGTVLPGLVRRRNAELYLYFKQ